MPTPPPKRRVPPGHRSPPPVQRHRVTGPADPIDAEQLDTGLGQGSLHRWSPMGQVEHMGQALRAWRRRDAEAPQWVRAVGWAVVFGLLLPVVLAAIYAVRT